MFGDAKIGIFPERHTPGFESPAGTIKTLKFKRIWKKKM
jgi:hypothetical protein